MKERYVRLSGDRYTSVNFGTFHAIFFKIIKSTYHYDNSSIITDDERNRILRDFVRDNSIVTDNEADLCKELASDISIVKSEQLDPARFHSGVCNGEQFINIFRAYEKYLKTEKKLDFDDMMVLCHRLFRTDKEALRTWQEQFEYILIDEFQDINLMQYEIVKMLALPQNNVFAVGDDDQSIYGFRGAHPELMFTFERDYPSCRRILLNYNYRSDTAITDAAAKLITHNSKRFKKNVIPNSQNRGRLVFTEFQTFEEENAFIADYAAEHRGEGESIAVLYRTNSEARNLFMLLCARNIRFKIRDRINLFFDHWIAKDIYAYLKLACGRGDVADLLRVANRPKRYITRESILDSGGDIKKLKEANRMRSYVTPEIEKLERNLAFIGRLNLCAQVKFIRKAVGYDAYIAEYAMQNHIDVGQLYEVLDILEESAHAFDSFDEWEKAIEESRKAAVAARTKVAEDTETGGCALELMTFHASKGLEFDTVFIIDALEGFTPQKLKISESEELLDEERRAFYVAMTRARHNLYILSSIDRNGRKFETSRFVSECGLSSNNKKS